MASELTATATALRIRSWQNNYHHYGITHREVDQDNYHRHGPTLKCWLAGNTRNKVYRKYEKLKILLQPTFDIDPA